MGSTTGIEWTDKTFNPWWGCIKVSPACDHCYAATLSKRYGHELWGKDEPRRFFGDKHWAEPLKWNQEAERKGIRFRVFCGSMCDVMEDRKDLNAFRLKLYDLIENTPLLDWQLLTKRPQNFRRFLPAVWLESPRLNVWGMTTVESNEYRWRIDSLVMTPFAVRGLSCEPLLGYLDIQHYLSSGSISWVIAGGESGPGARPAHPDWFRSIQKQCADAGIPYFFKQWGSWAPASQVAMPAPITHAITPDGRVAKFTREDMVRVAPEVLAWEGLRKARSKKNAGALLDEVEYKAFPA